jgi:hypothetical protein
VRFDARGYLDTLESPAFIFLDGEESVGRIPSAPEMSELAEAIEKFAGDGFKLPGEWPEFERFVRRLCELSELPADKMLAMPLPIMMAALVYLLGCLRGRTKEKTGASPAPDAAKGA